MNDLIDVIIFEHPSKEIQYRFTISEFRDVTYLSIREWYKDYLGHFAPSNNGITLPYTLHTCSGLFSALTLLLAEAETLEQVKSDQDFLKSLQVQAELYAEVSKLIGSSPYEVEKLNDGEVIIRCKS